MKIRVILMTENDEHLQIPKEELERCEVVEEEKWRLSSRFSPIARTVRSSMQMWKDPQNSMEMTCQYIKQPLLSGVPDAILAPGS